MKFYVASSWRNTHQPNVVDFLRTLGHDVYDFKNPRPGDHGFSWANIDPKWRSWTPTQFVDALKHPIAKSGFMSDFDAMRWADAGIMVLPCGRSASLALGWMAGAGKKTAILLPPAEIPNEPELMFLLASYIVSSLGELRYVIDGMWRNDDRA